MDIDWSIRPGAENSAEASEPPFILNTLSDARPRKKKARTLRETDWEPYKDRIIQLHHVEKRPLPEVRILIEQEFGFIAEIRQYRSRLTQWKLDKNIKSEEMRAIVRHRQQRELIETDKSSLMFRVRGEEVEPQKIERWMKRHDVIESMIYVPSPMASTPSAVSYATMSEIGSPGAHAMSSHGSLHDVNTDSDSGRTTPLLAFIPPNYISDFTRRPVDGEYSFAKWQYRHGQHRKVVQVLGMLSDMLRSYPIEHTRRLAWYVAICVVVHFVGDWFSSRFPQSTEKRVVLRFYIREVLPEVLPSNIANVRVYVEVPSQFSSWSWNMGLDLITGQPGHRQCKVAWTSGMVEPVNLAKWVYGYHIVKVQWDDLESFTWPGDDMD